MTKQRKVFGVLLTEQAWNDLADALSPYASEGPIGRYIYCQNVDYQGNYFVMRATCENPNGSSFEAEIAIPHHYVLCCISAFEESQIGFFHK